MNSKKQYLLELQKIEANHRTPNEITMDILKFIKKYFSNNGFHQFILVADEIISPPKLNK
ncbi:MAG: hypothetical protein A3B69_02680 [Gammaproteobacteria bacterium RIFCSPHIGHO2_02_FULL_38_33]|nr:MAG: hypothetical protein A3B69_02680 [Gammaproteobacteria bacterium RIFCSPHIGHO2_02_FULL_38_33]